MAEKGVLVSLKNIEINKENFRHEPLISERDAIHYLINEDLETYINLVKSMKQDLRSFFALLLKTDEGYKLMDANRRLSVIKIIDNPSLIPEGEIYDELRILCESIESLGVNEVPADIYDDSIDEDKENLFRALDELHMKDEKTKKDWHALAQYRASIYIGSKIKHPWMKTLLYYIGNDEDKIIKLTNRKTDIFNRILKKEILSIQQNGEIGLDNHKSIFEDIVKTVTNKFYIINGKRVKVDTRTRNEEFIDILEDIKNKHLNSNTNHAQKTEKSEEKDETKEKDSTDNTPKDSTENNSNKTEDKDDSEQDTGQKPDDTNDKSDNNFPKRTKQRTTIISKEQFQELEALQNDNINLIAIELKELDIQKYMLAGSALLRILCDYISKWYIREQMNDDPHPKNIAGNIMKVTNYMLTNKIITEKEKDKIKFIMNEVNTVNILNENIHDYIVEVNLLVLKSIYDTIHPIVKQIYKSPIKC